jgi:tetraacyldisaccharide 4'-kinase
MICWRGAAVERSPGMMYSPAEMRLLLLPFSLLSRLGSRIKNVLYDRGLLVPSSASVPVISAGNISLGGTGKTPLVVEILRWLLKSGRRPALVTRGYKGWWEDKGGILSDGHRILGTWREGGDEPIMVARAVPGAGVFVGKDRLASCRRAVELGFDIIVLDDGFQHRQLSRDLDIVLFSPEEKIALRESASALRRADIVLLIRESAEKGEKEQAHPGRTGAVFSYSVATRGISDLLGGAYRPPEEVAGMRIVAFCGIARPQRFLAQLRTSGIDPVAFLAFHDHHPYPAASLAKISRVLSETRAEAAVTTAKDAVKLADRSGVFAGIQVFVLEIGLDIDPEFWAALMPLVEGNNRT